MHAIGMGLLLPDTRLVFLVVLGCHVGAGLTAVVAGVIAMLARKRPGRHPKAGRTYLWALGGVFGTAAAMVGLRWPHNLHLLTLGTLAFGSGLTGYLFRRRHRPGWARWHILGMGGSYVLMLTAFYVDNGPRLPVWNLLPDWTFWVLPAAVGAPLILRALATFRPAGRVGRGSRRSDALPGPRPTGESR
jgi:hypothetical protein